MEKFKIIFTKILSANKKKIALVEIHIYYNNAHCSCFQFIQTLHSIAKNKLSYLIKYNMEPAAILYAIECKHEAKQMPPKQPHAHT